MLGEGVGWDRLHAALRFFNSGSPWHSVSAYSSHRSQNPFASKGWSQPMQTGCSGG
jgi:hypothetical protein